MTELQLNATKAANAEKSRAAVIAASRELDSFAADTLEAMADDYGTLPSNSEYITYWCNLCSQRRCAVFEHG